MFYSITGTICYVDSVCVALDCNGVAFRCFTSLNTLKQIGEKGAKRREISRLARADIEEQLGCPVHLEVWVRVRRGWSDDVKALKTLGYD